MPPPDSPHAHPTGGPDADRFAELLDLDGEVLHAYWTAALDLVHRTAGPGPVRHVLDLGCGTGVGALGLAERFGAATVTAVDRSEPLLRRLRAKAGRGKLAPRIRTVAADLDTGWPELGPLDVTWASMSLHHLADVDRVLCQLAAATRPGGLVAVAEFAAPLRFLSDDAGSPWPGLEARVTEALQGNGAKPGPNLRPDWAGPLRAAGFSVVEAQTFPIDVRPAGAGEAVEAAVRYARIWFDRVLAGAGDRMAPADRAAVAGLARPHADADGPERLGERRGLGSGAGLRIRGTRTVTIGRR